MISAISNTPEGNVHFVIRFIMKFLNSFMNRNLIVITNKYLYKFFLQFYLKYSWKQFRNQSILSSDGKNALRFRIHAKGKTESPFTPNGKGSVQINSFYPFKNLATTTSHFERLTHIRAPNLSSHGEV